MAAIPKGRGINSFMYEFVLILKRRKLKMMKYLSLKVYPFTFNPFKPNGFFHPYYLDESILHFKGVRLIICH